MTKNCAPCNGRMFDSLNDSDVFVVQELKLFRIYANRFTARQDGCRVEYTEYTAYAEYHALAQNDASLVKATRQKSSWLAETSTRGIA